MCKHTKVVFTGAGTRAFCAGGNLQADESGNGSRELFRVRVRVTVRVRVRVRIRVRVKGVVRGLPGGGLPATGQGHG